MQAPPPSTALVLSGGGTRGAYEAGVLAGVVEILGLRREDPSPFSVFSGTSVGALNAAWLASHAQHGDLALDGLLDLWRSLDPEEHGRIGLFGAWTRKGLLDVAPLERMVARGLDQDQLDANVASGAVRALVVAALHVGTGRTAVFVHARPDVELHTTYDSRRATVRTRITADHVLASSAIPGLFPARLIEGRLFWDGGLRFNTPIAPAIRCGASRLLVVSPLYQPEPPHRIHGTLDDLGADQIGGEPDLRFLLGKMLNAVLLDPIVHDLTVLDRFNEMLRVLDDTLAPHERRRFDDALARLRGQPYRPLETLVISPSQDLGAIAVEHLREQRGRYRRTGLSGWLLSTLGIDRDSADSDLASYLLFDGAFAGKLVALGRADAFARADDVRDFFGVEEEALSAG